MHVYYLAINEEHVLNFEFSSYKNICAPRIYYFVFYLTFELLSNNANQLSN